MANKRRPQKYQVPYIRYGKDGAVKTKLSKADSKKKNSSGNNEYYDSSYYHYKKKDNDGDEDDMFYTCTYGVKKHDPKRDYYEESEKEKIGNRIFENNERIEVSKPVLFSTEIFELILQFLSFPNGLNLKFFLVSKSFFQLCLKMLYKKPKLNSLNFNKFVDTMTNPSIVSYISYEITERYFQEYHNSGEAPVMTNSIKRNLKYAKTPLVRSLDLANIVQAGRNSNMTKILRRCCINLQELVAPQCSFGLTCLNIIKQCNQLVILDLSLVSETVNLLDLFNSIGELNYLQTLKFPRSSINCNLNIDFSEKSNNESSFKWPVNLRDLKLSGGITNELIMDLNFPNTLKILEFQHCPLVNDYSIYYLLSKIGRNLKSLSILYPMPKLKENSLDMIFRYCPFLESLQIVVDYVSQWCFNEVNFPWIINTRYIPGYNVKPFKEDVLLEGENLRKPYYDEATSKRHKFKYKFDDMEMTERDIIVATTTNYFENEEIENDETELSSEAEQNATELSNNEENTAIRNAQNEENLTIQSLSISVLSRSTEKENELHKLKMAYPGLESLRPLKTLYIGSSGTLGQANKVHPDDLIIALGEKRFPNLKSLFVSNRVGWDSGNDSMSELVDIFNDENAGDIYMCP